jgi:hypothetical protein
MRAVAARAAASPPPPPLGARARARRRPPRASPRRANAVETERGDAASGSDADARLADYLRSWCASTRGGVRADAADVAELRGVVRARRDASRGAPTDPAARAELAGTTWRVIGMAQATLPAPASWLASPFFWVAKEAQNESHRLATRVPNLFPPFKLAARLSAGWDDPLTGEAWIAAFGRRELNAAFPFNILSAALNRFDVPFAAEAARVSFDASGAEMTSRVRVTFGEASPREASETSPMPAGDGAAGRSVNSFARGGGKPNAFAAFFPSAVVGDLVTVSSVRAEEPSDDESSDDNKRGGDGSATVVGLRTTSFEFERRKPTAGGSSSRGFSVSVPSGAIMAALTAPSPRLRAMRHSPGSPGVRYARVFDDGEVMLAVAGSDEETETTLVYERVEESAEEV